MSAAPKRTASLLETYGSDTLEKIYGVPLFADIREDRGAIEALVSIMSSREISAGKNIVSENEPGTELFILIDGRASVMRCTPQGDQYKVALLSSDQPTAFGESGLIDADTRSATIRADTDCHCIVLERGAFDKYSASYPHWALPIYRRIAQSVMRRMKKTNDDMLLLYNALVAEIRGN